jgi:hypothetical protein
MKAYTDLDQSKKLAEILPLESADMEYMFLKKDNSMVSEVPFVKDGYEEPDCSYNMVHCWSLTALLAILPNEILTDERFECHYQIDIRKYDGGDKTTLYQIAYGNNRGFSGSWHDMINTGEKESLIDACYDMIIELKEMNLL